MALGQASWAKTLDDRPTGAFAHAAAVAFCADQFMEAPLHVAASTLLRHLRSDYAAHFYFLLTGFSRKNVQCLRRTLDRTGHSYTMHVFEDGEGHLPVEGLPSLHGSYVNYQRLLLPDLVDEDRLLYLDSDLEVDTDISPLFEQDMGRRPVGFVVDGKVALSLDGKFQISVGRSPDDPVFNDGVMLFNLPEWHRQGCSAAVWNFALKHRTELISHDQSILNAVFADGCYHLRLEFNVQLTAEHQGKVPKSGILHFVGNPKPWDVAARFFSPFADQWFEALKETAVPFSKRVAWFNRRSWQRLPRVIGGYRRVLKCRYRALHGRS